MRLGLLSDGCGIAGESLRSFGQATTLRELKILGNWTSAGIAKFTRWLAHLPKLEHLDIISWRNLGDEIETGEYKRYRLTAYFPWEVDEF